MTDRKTSDHFESDERRRQDVVLIRKVLSGDQDAMRQLVGRYDRLIRYTIFQTSRRHCERDPGWLDARANETWTGIVQSLRRSGPSRIPPQISGYFVRIAKNKCLDAAKRADARAVIPIEEGRADLEPADVETSPEMLLQGAEELERLQACLSRLSLEEQMICAEIGLIMERRWKEAAARLDLAESTLRSRWGAILDKLKGWLEKEI
jgi:RNA polymerase sigma factor (sigma-70 family)